MKNSFTNLLYDIANTTIHFLYGLIIIWLFLTAGFSTTAISKGEFAYYLSDNIFLNLVSLFFFAAIIIFLWKKCPSIRTKIYEIKQDKWCSLKIRRIFLFITFAVGISFVLFAQRTPTADQSDCSVIAGELLDHNYESFETGSYLSTCPHQMGIIWIFSFIKWIAGEENILAIQVINVVALTIFYWTLSRITDLLAKDFLAGTAVTFAGMMFIPAYFYTTFVYGTLLGLSFAAAGFYYCILFQRNKKIWQAVLMTVFLALSIVSKSNYLIFVFGVLIYELISLLSNKRAHTIIAILLTAFVLLGTGKGVTVVTKALTGNTLAEGESKWAYVAMGLQGGSNDHNPGWYNGYNARSFEQANFNTEAQTTEAKANVKESLTAFAAHPWNALKIFFKKNASQWNCPDFQGIWINQSMGSGGKLANPISWVFSMKGAAFILRVTNFLYELMITGLLLELILGRKERGRRPEYLTLKVILIGGFLFHTIWEAKAQYTLPYVMLLIPISVCGWELLFGCSSGVSVGRVNIVSAEGHLSVWGKGWFIGLAAAICAIQSGFFIPLNILFLRDSNDTADFYTLVQKETPLHLPEGEYELLAPTAKGNMEIAADNNPVNGTEQLYIRPVSQEDGTTDNGITLVHTSEWDKQYLELHANGMLLEVPDDHMEDGQIVQSGAQKFSPFERWSIYRCADGTFRIMLAEKALTFNEEGQYLYIMDWKDTPQQHWVLQAISD